MSIASMLGWGREGHSQERGFVAPETMVEQRKLRGLPETGKFGFESETDLTAEELQERRVQMTVIMEVLSSSHRESF